MTRDRARHAAGVPVLLLRAEAETGDIAALELAQGLLTTRGARTSHAAVVARQLGKVCLVDCEALQIDLAQRRVTIGGRAFCEGDLLTLDGNAGCVHAGLRRTVCEADPALLARLAGLRLGRRITHRRSVHAGPSIPLSCRAACLDPGPECRHRAGCRELGHD